MQPYLKKLSSPTVYLGLHAALVKVHVMCVLLMKEIIVTLDLKKKKKDIRKVTEGLLRDLGNLAPDAALNV